MVRLVEDVSVGRAPVRQTRNVAARQTWIGVVGSGKAWIGRSSRGGENSYGKRSHGVAWYGKLRLSTSRRRQGRQGMAGSVRVCPVRARLGAARQTWKVKVWRGAARHGLVGFGWARQTWCGLSGRDEAVTGTACHGLLRRV